MSIRIPGPGDAFGRPRPGPGARAEGEAAPAPEARETRSRAPSALGRARALIGVAHAGAALTAERIRLLSEGGGARGAPAPEARGAFERFARDRIAALPEGRRAAAALHAGREARRLEIGLRRRARETEVRALQGEVDAGLSALTEAAGQAPGTLAALAERGLGLLEAANEGLRYTPAQRARQRARFGERLTRAALRSLPPGEALTVLAGGAVESLVPDRAARAGLRLELESALALEERAARAETAALEALHLERLGRGEAGLPDLEGDIRAERGAAAARAFAEASAAARRRHLLSLRYRSAPLSEIEAALAAETPDGAPGGHGPNDSTRRSLLEEVTGEILAERRRDPAAAVADHPWLKALEEEDPDDPERRPERGAVLGSLRLELQGALGIAEGARRLLTRRELAALTGAIEATPGGARVALLKDLKARYGRHFGRLAGELREARLDPVTLAMAERLDDPLALRRLERLAGRSRADLSEGLDPGDVKRLTDAARRGPPPELAPVFAGLALDRYRQSQDLDDAVAVAAEALGVDPAAASDLGRDGLIGGSGDDDLDGDDLHRARVPRDAKDFAIDAVDVLTDLVPVVGEVKAFIRAWEALGRYEAALEADDPEAARRHLLEFGQSLMEMTPGVGRFGKAGRVLPGLDKLKTRIGRLAADLLGAGKVPGGAGQIRSGVKRRGRGGRERRPSVIDRHPPGHYTKWKTPEDYAKVVDKTPTLGSRVADVYERRVAGPDTYRLVKRDPETGEIIRDAQGKTELMFNADGLRGSTILEAKHVKNPDRSPYIDGSKMPDIVRERVHKELDNQLDRIKQFIEDPGNPLSEVEIITNNKEAEKFFLRKLEEFGLKGTVVVREGGVP